MALFDIVKPRICELGKIKIGGKSAQVRTTASGGTWRAPEKYDHFIVTTLHRNPKGDLIPDEALMDSLREYADSDGKLRQLPIVVLSNEIEEVMQASYVWYVGKRVAARSDGVTLTKFYEHKGKQWLDEPEELEWKEEFLAGKDSRGVPLFKQHAVFSCIIAAKQAHWGGVYKLRTTSVITAAQLAGSLREIKLLTGGILRGLPLRLVLRPMQVAPNGQVSTVYVIHCEVVGEDMLAIQNMALQRAKLDLENSKQLERARLEYKELIHAPGFGEPAVEDAEIVEEFHPEQAQSEPPAVDPIDDKLGIGPVLASENGAPPQPAREPGDDSDTIDPEALELADILSDLAAKISAAETTAALQEIGAEMMRLQAGVGPEAYEQLHRAYSERFNQLNPKPAKVKGKL